jgi:hypothetical protein
VEVGNLQKKHCCSGYAEILGREILSYLRLANGDIAV